MGRQMKRLTDTLNHFFQRASASFLGLAMILLTAITFIQVIARYFLKISIGGLEELPVYLMVASVWLAAALLTHENGHITLDILDMLVKNKKSLALINCVLDAVVAAALAAFDWIMAGYMAEGMKSGTISPGLKFPLWWMTALTVVCVTLMVIFTIRNIAITLKEIRHGNFN